MLWAPHPVESPNRFPRVETIVSRLKVNNMLIYRADVLHLLKDAGYNTSRIREERSLSESAIQSLRNGEMVGIKSLDKICGLLQMQPGDLIEWEGERMTNLEILMADGCTRHDAEKHLKNGAIIYSDFAEHLESYLKEWRLDEDDADAFREMIRTGKPVADWGIVKDGNTTYYIEYIL